MGTLRGRRNLFQVNLSICSTERFSIDFEITEALGLLEPYKYFLSKENSYSTNSLTILIINKMKQLQSVFVTNLNFSPCKECAQVQLFQCKDFKNVKIYLRQNCIN